MNILETAAHTHSPFLHPGGETMTRVLIEKLALRPGQWVLEIGCGTGATAVKIAETTPVRIIALDQHPAMLAAAEARFLRENRFLISLLAANASDALPFSNAAFDAVYAESVLALTQVPEVLHEIARLLRPGGKFVLNERLWKPGVTAEEATHINALSQTCFGIPAATPEPWDKNDWLALLQDAGFVNLNAIPVQMFIPIDHQQQLRLSQRLTHLQHHLHHPRTFFRNLQFRLLGRRHKKIWRRLEAVLLTGNLNDAQIE